MPVPLFDIRDLAKVYSMGEVEVHALREVSLTLAEGQFVVHTRQECSRSHVIDTEYLPT